MIRVPVRDITIKGIDIDQTIPKEGIGLTDEEVDLRSPLKIKAHLTKSEGVVIADTEVRVTWGYFCARCLETFESEQTAHYHFDFPLEPDTEDVDVGEEIRQEMILSNPAKVLCKEDCKGICPKCGANLNIEQCTCKK